MTLFWIAVSLAVASDTTQTLADELDRAMSSLASQVHAPHYISGELIETEHHRISAIDGVVFDSPSAPSRTLDVDLRIGSPEFDSTHAFRDGYNPVGSVTTGGLRVPLTNGEPLQHAIWRQAQARYRDAERRWLLLKAERHLKVPEEDPAADFSPSPPHVSHAPPDPIDADLDRWRTVLAEASARLSEHPHMIQAAVGVDAIRTIVRFADTEGSRIAHGRRHARAWLQAQGIAPDGDRIEVSRSVDAHDESGLDPSELHAWLDDALQEFDDRRNAPRGEPYTGPVLLSGQAAAVFFHEVLGHRVEGHRQKRETEGKTFAGSVGEPILPSWVDVYDDPTLSTAHGVDLNGHYSFDNEGVAPQRATLVRGGLFQGFLMSRSPIAIQPSSNGHGRRSPGNPATARMGNTIVEASQVHSEEQLRARFRQALRQAGLEAGYRIERIDGGFTMTGRVVPNAFNVRATTTWRVFADGRPDQMVRGVDLVGTPLTAFRNVVAAGDEPAVFNGICGAESGWVPVSAVAPPLLFSELELQLKEKAQQKPPLVPPPGPPFEVAEPVDALREALARYPKSLSLPNAPSIYHLRYALEDTVETTIVADGGGLVERVQRPRKSLGVDVRVGDPTLDNTGTFGGFDGFTRASLPHGASAAAVARATWRTTDQAYKWAAESYGQKRAILQSAAPRTVPDYLKQAGTRAHVPQTATAWDLDDAGEWAKRASARLAADVDDLWRAEVHVGQETGGVHLLDSEGSAIHMPLEELSIRALLSVRLDDGSLLTDQELWTMRDPSELPDDGVVVEALDAIKSRVHVAAHADPLSDPYVGPVVFEDAAAVDLFRFVLTPQLESALPTFEANHGLRGMADTAPQSRAGRRALPRGWSVVDDPTTHMQRSSGFAFDGEGTPTQNTTLVADGIVRQLVSGRTPSADAPTSSGSARGRTGQRLAGRVAQVTVEPNRRISRKKLHKKAASVARSYGLDRYVVVRRLQAPAVRAADDERVSASLYNNPVSLPSPVAVFMRALDGSETPFRDVRFVDVHPSMLKDIVAASRQVEREVLTSLAFGPADTTPISGLPTWISAPEVLIGELEVLPDTPEAQRAPRWERP